MKKNFTLKGYNSLSPQIKAALWYTICNLMQKGISLIAVPLYTRILTAEQYGAYSVFLSWLDIFEIVATFRLSWGGYIVGLTKNENDRDGYTSSMQFLSITLTSICFIVYLLFSPWINRVTGMTFSLIIMIFALMYTLPAISFWTARQRVELRYVAAVVVTMISSLLIPTLGITLAVTIPQKEVAVIGARVVVQGCIGLILIFVNFRKKIVLFNKKYWKTALLFNGTLLPYYFSMVLLNSSDRIIIQHLVGQKQAGIYGVAYSASMVMQLFNSSINSSLQPWMFRQLKMKKDDKIAAPVNLSLVIIGILNLLLIAFAPEAIYILAPPTFHEAIWLIPPLASSAFVIFSYQHFVNIEFYFQDSKMISYASIAAAVLNVLLNYALIPIFGYITAGYTTLLCYVIFGCLHYIFMRKVCKKNNRSTNIINIKSMILLLICFFLLSSILMFGYTCPPIRYCVIVILISWFIWKRKLFFSILKEVKKA